MTVRHYEDSMDPDELELDGTEHAQTDEAEGATEGNDDGEVSEGTDESAEVGSEDDGESSGSDEAAIAAAAAQAQVNNKPQSRAQERIRRQQEELQREREARIRLETQLAEQQRYRQAQDQQADQFRQQQYLETLDPAERQAYMLQQQMEQMRREMQQQQFAQADLLDKTAFQQRALQNPMVAKYADRVEQTLQEMRSKGQTAPRESILKFLVGEEVLNKAPAAVARATKAASKPASRPLRARGNAAPSGPAEDADLEERLAKLSF